MQPKWMRRLGVAALIGAVGWASLGCAAERDPINRVQPQALNKAFFIGEDLRSPGDDPEFYMRNTVVDVPFGAGQMGLFTASFAQPVSRVRWEIQERALIARQTHEHISNSDGKGTRRTNDGQVVAMFPILSHFDIRRDYNPVTGEEMNVVGENNFDRPWYERQYMRVDWSTNMVTDGYQVDTLSQIGFYGGVRFSPMAYHVTDSNDPNAPVIAQEEGYFDVTSKAFASPQMVYFEGFGNVPACFLFGQYPVTKCDPTELTLRLSFRKVTDTDFEPQVWDGNKMDAFGVFYEERFGYERNVGVVDQRRHRFVAKYNLWEKSHIPGTQCAIDQWRDESGNVLRFKGDGASVVTDGATGLPIPDPNGIPFTKSAFGKDVHRDENGNGTEDECEFFDASGTLLNPGSRCNEFTRKCTIPTYARTIKAHPWYYGPESPPDLYPSTFEAVNQWNNAVRRALAISKVVEARRVGLNAGEIPSEEAVAADVNGDLYPHVFVLCHNPVIEEDHEACGKRGLRARVGDLRYSMVNLIPTPQAPSPWGIMVDAVDPLTGEKVAGSANEWTHVLDLAAQNFMDVLRWVNGEASDTEIANGDYLKDWIESSKLGTAEYQPKTLVAKEVTSRLESIAKPVGQIRPLPNNWQEIIADPRATRQASEQLSRKFGPSLDGQFEAIRQSLIGSPLEAMLVDRDMVQAIGLDPSTTQVAGNDSLMAMASPLRGMNPMVRSQLQQMKLAGLAKNGICMIEQPEPSSYVGVARLVQKLFPMPDRKAPDFAKLKFERDRRVHNWLRENMHLSVIAHELGHSMSLRHNFTGSWDALNYPKEYWQLRTRNGAEQPCRETDRPAFGQDGKLVPFNPQLSRRYAVDPHTDGKDCVGPRWVDPVTEEEVNGLIWRWGNTTVMDYPGDITQDFNGLGPYDKAAMRFIYGEVADVERATGAKRRDYLRLLDSSSSLQFVQKHYSEYGKAYNVLGKCEKPTDPNDPLSAKCSGFDLEYVATRDLAPEGNKTYAVAKFDRNLVRHPYMFSSDEYATPTNVSSNRFDAGADPYEKMQFLITAYENRYIFDYFRRNRVQFTTGGVVDRVLGRYFDQITGVTKILGLYMQVYNELLGEGVINQLTTNPGLMMAHAIASADGFAHFSRVITRPEPGEYVILPGGYAKTKEAAEDQQDPDFTISAGSGEGRYINNDYDFNKGYFWSDFQTRVGSTYEKRFAPVFMLEAYNRFVQVDRRDFIDGRWKNINYATVYPEQMRRLMSSVMQSDPQTLGPYVLPNTGGATKGAATRVFYPAWDKTETVEYPTNAVALEPLVGWEQQYPALIFSMYYAPTSLTMDWFDQMRVWVRGGNEGVEVAGEIIQFTDPESTIVYTARDYGTETIHNRVVNRASGARMLQFANQLLREAYNVDANGNVIRDANKRPSVKDPVKALALRRFVSNLAVVRQVTDWFGQGPLGRGR